MIQLQMIEAVKSMAREDENISAVLMYGSFTKGEGDRYSDIEFYIFMKEKEGFSGEAWVNRIHPVAVYFTNEYGNDVALFENMIRGEFHFLSTGEIGVVKSWEGFVTFSDFDKMNLIDKEGLLADTLREIKVKSPDRATRENIIWLSQSLINVSLTTSNLIKREEYAHAYHSLINVQRYLLWLIRVAARATDHWETPTKNMEKDIDREWYEEFKRTTTDLDPERMKKAFLNSLKLSEKLFDQLNIDNKLKQVSRRIK